MNSKSNKSFAEHYSGDHTLLVYMGAAMLIVGALFLIVMEFIARFLIFLLGLLLLAGGVIFLIYGILNPSNKYFKMILGISIFSLVTGIFALVLPNIMAALITLIIGIFFAAYALIAFIASYMNKEKSGNSIVMGVINSLFSILVFAHWPYNSITIIGFFIALDFVVGGIWLLILARDTKIEKRYGDKI